jgi:hypothetical protein
MKTCEADGCNKVLVRAKYCHIHRRRFIRHRDPNYRIRVAKGEWDGITCSAKDCDRPVRSKGFCHMHYARDLRLKHKGLTKSFTPFKLEDYI